jgi:hypothetical protein
MRGGCPVSERRNDYVNCDYDYEQDYDYAWRVSRFGTQVCAALYALAVNHAVTVHGVFFLTDLSAACRTA